MLPQKPVYLHELLFNFFISLLMGLGRWISFNGTFLPPYKKHDIRKLKRSYICIQPRGSSGWLRFVILNSTSLYILQGKKTETKINQAQGKRQSDGEENAEAKWYLI